MGGRVEVLGVERRRRWTPEEKVAILDEAFGGRSSVAEVSERRGVSRALIYYWRRQAREGAIAGVGMASSAEPSFVPVRIEPLMTPAVSPKAAPMALPRSRRRSPPLKAGSGLVEIALCNGRTIKVDAGIDPEALARLVAVLDGGAP
jgi:transposase